MRRHQKEQAEKERLRIENEKRREREEEEALEKTRYKMLLILLGGTFIVENIKL